MASDSHIAPELRLLRFNSIDSPHVRPQHRADLVEVLHSAVADRRDHGLELQQLLFFAAPSMPA
jgi:hypothetical protein